MEPPGDVQIVQPAPGRLRVGDDEPPEVHCAAVIGEVLLQPPPEMGDRRIDVFPRADDDDPVAGAQLISHIDHLGAVIPLEIAHPHALGGEARNVPQIGGAAPPRRSVEADRCCLRGPSLRETPVEGEPDDDDRNDHGHGYPSE